jgi:quinolinate synthase
VESLHAHEILFIPDQYLGHYVSARTGKKMILWPGFCPTHVRIRPERIRELRREYPQAKVVVHPECTPEVIALADEVFSTSGMCRYARRDEVREMVVGTEVGLIHRLRKENPGKRFIPVSDQAICPNMKLINLEKVLWSLEEMSPEVKVPEEIRLKAIAAVDRMLQTKS